MSRSIKNLIRQSMELLLPTVLWWKLSNWYYHVRLSEDAYRNYRTIWYQNHYDGRVVHLANGKYRLHSNETISRYFFAHQEFDAQVRDLLLLMAPECQTFIDIGANIGLISVALAQATRLPILSIEPVVSNCALLVENSRLNHVQDQIEILQLALGDTIGLTDIYLSPVNSGDHRLTLHSGERRPTERVKVETLDHCLAQKPYLQPPYLIKVDVQGYEFHVLLGAEKTISHPVFIVAEIWPVGLQESGTDIDMFNDFCASNRLQIYRYDLNQQARSPQLLAVNHLREVLKRIPARRGAHTDIVLTNMPIKTRLCCGEAETS
jgi:FkbM family methyltransferase